MHYVETYIMQFFILNSFAFLFNIYIKLEDAKKS